MRPSTLAEAVERIIAGEPEEKALPEFCDTFYSTTDAQQRLASLASTPPLSGNPRLDAFVGGIAEYLARQYKLEQVPDWAFEPSRYLDRAWHVSEIDAPAMREYLTFSSPAEFRSRNIFTEERPLRRARSALADQVD
jgi:hypothetical protein